jgi:hypothetical protein
VPRTDTKGRQNAARREIARRIALARRAKRRTSERVH